MVLNVLSHGRVCQPPGSKRPRGGGPRPMLGWSCYACGWRWWSLGGPFPSGRILRRIRLVTLESSSNRRRGWIGVWPIFRCANGWDAQAEVERLLTGHLPPDYRW